MKWREVKPEVWVLVVLVVGAAGFFIWDRYFTYDPAEVYENAKKQYVEAMTADTYGGKTPQETLDLFVAALKKEDVDLASKYFLLDEVLSKNYGIERLNDIKNRGLLFKMIADIEQRARPDLKNIIGEDDYKFVLYSDNGKVGARINMQFNKYSGVWKIENI